MRVSLPCHWNLKIQRRVEVLPVRRVPVGVLALDRLAGLVGAERQGGQGGVF
jgi:hypothetical protein